MPTPDPTIPLQPLGNPVLIEIIREEIRRHGPMTFARFMKTALYHDEHGYYRTPHRKPGRGGDFITSPELHPYFGFTIARQIAECWDRLGQPQQLIVREHGAGIGVLAYDIIAALTQQAPDVRDALDYRLVEVNEYRAAESRAAMDEAGLSHLVRSEHPDEITPELGIVLANEVADALPVHRLIVRDQELRECWVSLDEEGHFLEEEGVLSQEVAELDVPSYLNEVGVDLAAMPERARLDISPAIAEWACSIAANLIRGYAIVIDYGYDAPTLYRDHRLVGTVRGYFEHTVTDNPYIRVGEQDLTAHVDFTWLTRAATESGMTEIGLTTQSEFLTQLGLGDWLVQLQTEPDTSLEEYYRA
ncbi:MAG TPA: SAM-dependent methyltransferase, partial [Thermomicrobiales bacterium]|nr:SAM-dependent methyltransferase [Thermomicrobiales bacterium]